MLQPLLDGLEIYLVLFNKAVYSFENQRIGVVVVAAGNFFADAPL